MPSRALDRFTGAVANAEALSAQFSPANGVSANSELLQHAALSRLVAAWDGYLNDVIKETLQRLRRPSPTHYSFLLNILDANAAVLLDRFNTPNTQNTKDIFQRCIGLDPCPYWKRPKARQTAYAVGVRLDEILRVRHSIAHGFPMPIFTWNVNSSNVGVITKKTYRSCQSLVCHIATQTDVCIANHVADEFGLKRPW